MFRDEPLIDLCLSLIRLSVALRKWHGLSVATSQPLKSTSPRRQKVPPSAAHAGAVASHDFPSVMRFAVATDRECQVPVV